MKCRKCQQRKPRKAFAWRPEAHCYRRICKVCHNAQCRKWYRKNQQQSILKSRKWRLKTRYGLSHEDYLQMLKQQHYCCAICRSKFTEDIHVDHDHKTMKVRGLLCFPCNAGLSNFKDRKALLEAALQYLEGKSGWKKIR